MIEIKSLYGKPVDREHAVVPDHVVQTFTVTVRSLAGLTTQQVKEQLQKKWEVVEMRETANTIYVA